MRAFVFHLTLLFLAVSGEHSLPTQLPGPWGQDAPRQELFQSSSGILRPPPDPRRKGWPTKEEEGDETQLLDSHASTLPLTSYQPYPSVIQLPDRLVHEDDSSILSDEASPSRDQRAETLCRGCSSPTDGFDRAATLPPLMLQGQPVTTVTGWPFINLQGASLPLFCEDEIGCWGDPMIFAQVDTSMVFPSPPFLLEASGTTGGWSPDCGKVEWSPLPQGTFQEPHEPPPSFSNGLRRSGYDVSPLGWAPNDEAMAEEVPANFIVTFGPEHDFSLPANDIVRECSCEDFPWCPSEESSWTEEYIPFMPLPTLFPYHIPSGFSLDGRSHSASSICSTIASDCDGWVG